MLRKISDNKTQGIIYALLACLSISLIVGIVRHLSKEMHVFQIVMMRNLFALIFLLPFIIKSLPEIFRTKNIKLHLIRGLNGLISMLAWFYVITVIPLPEAVSISFIVPILTTLAAVLFLKERVNKKIWLSLLIGFIGILIILRPGFRNLNSLYFVAIFSTCLWVLSNILIKKMSKTEKPQAITFYLTMTMFTFSVPIAAPYLKSINTHEFFWLMIVGGLSNLAYITTSIAYSKSELSVLQPFDFSRLIFTSIIAYFAFDQVIDLWTLIGSLVILYSSIILLPGRSIKINH